MFNKIYDVIKNFMKDYGFFLIGMILILICVFVRVPYEVNMPGGIIDLENRVMVDGESANIEGSFNMAYVSVAQGSIPHVLLSFIIPDWDLEPISDVTYENETIEEANEREKLLLLQSKNMAMVAALEAANIEYTITNNINYVAYIDSKAKTDLQVGDNIIECNGKKILNIDEITDIIQSEEVGKKVSFKVLRDDKEVETYGIVYEEDDKKIVGISAITIFDLNCDKEIEISSKTSESGPSGGLMMSLMVYNALTNQDLTHGKKIVGTGTISRDGTVGEIGGVKYKVMGAFKADADVFLVPEGNYDEAIKVKEEKGYDLEIVEVKTLQDAINYLEGL